MSKFNIIKLDAIGSTNDWLKDKFFNGNCSDGDVIWVMNQTAGKGQRSKVWTSEAGKNLTFSMFKHFPTLPTNQSFLINCAVTLGIVKALEKFGIPKLKIKWPNDILSANKKIGGVLIENFIKGNEFNGTIIGVGINVNQESFDDLPYASSMILEAHTSFDLNQVLVEVLNMLSNYIEILNKLGGMNLLSDFEKNMYKKGELSEFKSGEEIFEGKIIGVSKEGSILIEKSPTEILRYANGEIEMIY